MSDLEKAARLALEVLEQSRVFVTTREKIKHPEGTEWYDERITALRQVLEQPTQQEPVISTAHGPWIPSTHPGEEGESYCQRCLLRDKFLGSRQCEPHIVEQPAQQEPVGYVYSVHGERIKNACIESDVPNGTPLYILPQRKPLTDEAVWSLYKNLWMFHPAEEPRLAGDILKFARAIEAAHGIKEKNNG